jgi:hypothetical protein
MVFGLIQWQVIFYSGYFSCGKLSLFLSITNFNQTVMVHKKTSFFLQNVIFYDNFAK